MKVQPQTGIEPGSGHARPATPVDLRELIVAEVTKLAVTAYEGSLLAIVLAGSLARDEATWARDGSRWLALGDAEFILVFRPGTGFPHSTEMDSLRLRVESALRQHAVTCPVTVDAVSPDYFRKLPPHIFTYELRTSGQVVWGDSHLLSLIPAFGTSEILLEDAWRLLTNRTIEQLACQGGVQPQAAAVSADLANERSCHSSYAVPSAVAYPLAKLYLDMATSFLVFAGAYEPTYRSRAQKLAELADRCSGGVLTAAEPIAATALPFPLREFAKRVSEFTRYKLGEAEWPVESEAAGASLGESAREYAKLLWRWELQRLKTSSIPRTSSGEALRPINSIPADALGEAPIGQLVEDLMRRQPIRDRWRGWLFVARKCGWLRSWRFWPRWWRLCRKGSPRYCIYRGAGELFSLYPSTLAGSAGSSDRNVAIGGVLHGANGHFNDERVRAWLPVAEPIAGTRKPVTDRGSGSPRQELAAAVVWNYHEFLTGTRA